MRGKTHTRGPWIVGKGAGWIILRPESMKKTAQKSDARCGPARAGLVLRVVGDPRCSS
jgi:hypothetical protein